MEEGIYNRKRIIAVVGGFIVVVAMIVAIALVNIVPKIGKIEVYVGYAPFVANVTLNGNRVKNNANNYLEKGNYKVEVTLDGFKSLEEEVTIDDENKKIFGSIVAETKEAIRIASEHINDYETIQSLFGEEAIKKGEKNRKEWPMVTKLPVTNSLYKLGYVIENNEITLTVSAYAVYVDMAVKKLKEVASEVGDDLANYRIEFKNYDDNLADSFVMNDGATAEEYIGKGFAGVSSFRFVEGVRDDEYYYAKISTGSDESYTLVHSKLILRNIEGGWKLVSKVSPILTIYSAEGVPVRIIDAANNL